MLVNKKNLNEKKQITIFTAYFAALSFLEIEYICTNDITLFSHAL